MKIKIITTLLALGCLSAQANILITEYVEGGGNNKALEISNLGSTNVDLASEGYKLSLYANGSTNVKNELLLQGLLVPNSSIVVYNANATDAFKKAAPQGLEDTGNVTYFNGDDGIVLSNTAGVVDVFGQIGSDPGKNWGTGNLSTKDHTLRRLNTITQGDIIKDDAFDPASEWQGFPKDTSDGLGCTGESACTGSEPQPETGTVIGGTTPPTNQICTNCPTLEKVADRNTYDEATYYIHADAATDNTLRAAIITDISANQKQLTYSEVWTALTHTDEDPNNANNIILIYSGFSIPKKNNGSGAGASNQDFWNREHVWPKSHGFPDQSQRGYTDINHLHPADISMNSDRGNKDFGDGGDPVTEAPKNLTTSTTWEPRDAVKGDVARAMFYMDVRYDPGTDSTMPDLQLVDQTTTAASTLADGVGKLGKLCTLLEWNSLDPIDNFELNRNNTVYEYQGNRNPFIDHPEWIERIYGNACSAANIIPTVNAGSDQSIVAGNIVTITATAADSDGSVDSYQWLQTSTGNSITLTNADTKAATFTAPSVTTNATLEFTVTVTDDKGAIASDTVTITVTPEPVVAPPIVKKSSGGSFFWLLIVLGLCLPSRRKI